MTTHIKTALALMTGVVLGGVGFGALHAQTKAQPAYWVTEVLEMQDQAAFTKAIQAVPPTVQNFGGRYIVLGGKLTADIGPVPKRIAIVAFDSMDKAQGWLSDPTARGLRDEVNKHAQTRAYAVEGTANEAVLAPVLHGAPRSALGRARRSAIGSVDTSLVIRPADGWLARG